MEVWWCWSFRSVAHFFCSIYFISLDSSFICLYFPSSYCFSFLFSAYNWVIPTFCSLITFYWLFLLSYNRNIFLFNSSYPNGLFMLSLLTNWPSIFVKFSKFMVFFNYLWILHTFLFRLSIISSESSVCFLNSLELLQELTKN